MKSILFFTFIILNLFSTAQTLNIDVLRKEYSKVKTDSAGCAKLYERLVKENSTDNTFVCYKGAISTVMANYSTSKIEKFKLFNEGKKLIEQCIAKDTNNTELRFLRFTVQTSCPKALGYNHQIENDKKIIVANYNSIKSSVLHYTMFGYLYNSKYLTEEEKYKITH